MIDTSPYDPEFDIDPSVGFESYNNVDIAINNLPEQFRETTNVQNFIATFVSGVQNVENLLASIFLNTELGTSVGIQLDQLGALFGELRAGRNDEDYRAAIRNRISIITSNATPDTLLGIMKLITQSEKVNIHEHYPASLSISAQLDRDMEAINSIYSLSSDVANNIKSASPISVGVVTSLFYLDENALLGELSFDEGTMIVESDGEFDLVNEDGDFIEYASLNKGADLGGLGVLAEIIPESAGLEITNGVLDNWTVVGSLGTDNLVFVSTDAPEQVGSGESGVLAEVIIND